MSYTPTTWVNGVTDCDATNLNHIEQGIADLDSSKAPLVSPSFTTPTLGVATATSINKVTITQPASAATITIYNGKTFTCTNTLTLQATDGSTLWIGTGGTLGSAAYTASTNYAASSHTHPYGVVYTKAFTNPTPETYDIPVDGTLVKMTADEDGTIRLHTAVGYDSKEIVIVRTASGTGVITLATVSSQTVNGAAPSLSSWTTWTWYKFRSDGANWLLSV